MSVSVNYNLWWIDATLWEDGNRDDDGFIDSVSRPCERRAIRSVRKQANREREALLKLLIQLERWFIFHEHEMSPYKRITAVAMRVGMTHYQVVDALKEGYDQYGDQL